jgi:hypothetical protein
LTFATRFAAASPNGDRDRDEFDLIQQLVPEGQFIYF